MRPLTELLECGQSFWLDNLSRDIIRSGELQRRVDEQGLRGVTSNPAIFHKAIADDTAYDEEIASLAGEGASVAEMYERLVVADIREACDVLRPVYQDSDGVDGYVSLEVSPRLIHDTAGSIDEGRRLWGAVDRPNLMIKIPGTPEGVPAIEELLYDGINVNVTLLFDVASYDEVARAHQRALRRRLDAGRPLGTVASVASFFLSRIDVLVDSLLAHRIDAELVNGAASGLLGEAGIASAKLAYRSFERHYGSDEWNELAEAGARVQRLLWASTSTKNPLYDPVRYVEPLIGADTVNTMPEVTIEAFATHGRVVADTIRDGADAAAGTFEALARVGIDMRSVALQLVNEGARKFIVPFDGLLAGLAARRSAVLGTADELTLSETAREAVAPLIEPLAEMRFSRRLLAGDPMLWTDDPEVSDRLARRAGALPAAVDAAASLDEFERLGGEIAGDAIEHVVVLGVGGEGLAAAALAAAQADAQALPEAQALSAASGGPKLVVLAAVDPEVVRDVSRRIDPSRTLFLAADRTGCSLETLSLVRYCHALVEDAGVPNPGARFIALTQPDSPLAAAARERAFLRVVGTPADGGPRFSALAFGLLPAVLAGLDPRGFVESAHRMAASGAAAVPLAGNPAIGLGVALAALAAEGRDKLTILTGSRLGAFAAWIEHLIATSTGGAETGILPVAGEPMRPVAGYADDRVFVDIRFRDHEAAETGARLAALEAAGHPVIRVRPGGPAALGGEFLRWEIAAAAAAALLGANPFDEPRGRDPQSSARDRLAELGDVDPHAERPLAAERGLELFLEPQANGGAGLRDSLQGWMDGIGPGDHIAVLACFGGSERRDRLTARLRRVLGARTGAATTLGPGPRLLHVAGRPRKDGRAAGACLVLTADSAEDVHVPGATYGLADLRRARALGEVEALRAGGRDVVRVNLGWYVEDGLAALSDVLEGNAGKN